MRVKVWRGDNGQLLGLGTALGEHQIHVFMARDYQSMVTPTNPEVRPSDALIEEMDKKGYFLSSGGEMIMKIRMDGGDIVWGSEVWWEPWEEAIEVDPLEVFRTAQKLAGKEA